MLRSDGTGPGGWDARLLALCFVTAEDAFIQSDDQTASSTSERCTASLQPRRPFPHAVVQLSASGKVRLRRRRQTCFFVFLFFHPWLTSSPCQRHSYSRWVRPGQRSRPLGHTGSEVCQIFCCCCTGAVHPPTRSSPPAPDSPGASSYWFSSGRQSGTGTNSAAAGGGRAGESVGWPHPRLTACSRPTESQQIR